MAKTVTGVDPGSTNCAIVTVAFEGDRTSCYVAVPGFGGRRCGPADLARKVCKAVAAHAEAHGSEVVAVERQSLGNQNKVMMAALIGWAMGRGSPLLLVDPKDVKIAAGLGCHGHAANKKNARRWLKEKGAECGVPEQWTRSDHVADALMTALFAAGRLDVLAVTAKDCKE